VRRLAGKLPHHGVEGRGEQEAEQRHAEHPEEHGGPLVPDAVAYLGATEKMES
jgi:hypothetical protein